MKSRTQFAPNSLIETDDIGKGTNVFVYTHIMKGAFIGKNCSIGEHCFIESGVRIGDNVVIKNGCLIWEGVFLEDEVFLGPGVILTNDKYPRSTRMKDSPIRHRNKSWLQNIVIKKGASIGAGSIIIAGVEIGEYALIGAGSVVTKNVRAHELAAGNPSRQLGWVCICGMKLIFDADLAQCDECNKKFKLVKNEILYLGT